MPKMSKRPFDEFAMAAEQEARQVRGIGLVTVRKIVEEQVPVEGGGSATIGEVIDAHLREMVLAGQDILDVTFSVDPADYEGRAAVREIYSDSRQY
jgi:hypothetical protein